MEMVNNNKCPICLKLSDDIKCCQCRAQEEGAKVIEHDFCDQCKLCKECYKKLSQ
jgi:hypothetical protein